MRSSSDVWQKRSRAESASHPRLPTDSVLANAFGRQRLSTRLRNEWRPARIGGLSRSRRRGSAALNGSGRNVAPRAALVGAAGVDDTRAQSQTGQSKTAQHQQGRCEPRNSFHGGSFREVLTGRRRQFGMYRPRGRLPIPSTIAGVAASHGAVRRTRGWRDRLPQMEEGPGDRVRRSQAVAELYSARIGGAYTVAPRAQAPMR